MSKTKHEGGVESHEDCPAVTHAKEVIEVARLVKAEIEGPESTIPLKVAHLEMALKVIDCCK